ncbi:MAG: hypothetical protein KF764_34470 [Labilithrix sp.]|nr:hypothetical protein [Labilithrix sp.]
MYSCHVGDRAAETSQSTEEGAVQTVATLGAVSAAAAVKSVIAPSKMHSESVGAAAKYRHADSVAAFVEPKHAGVNKTLSADEVAMQNWRFTRSCVPNSNLTSPSIGGGEATRRR